MKSSHLHSGNPGKSLVIILKTYDFTFYSSQKHNSRVPKSIWNKNHGDGMRPHWWGSFTWQTVCRGGHCSHLMSSRLSFVCRLWTCTGWKLLFLWKALVSLTHFRGLFFKFFDPLGLPWVPEDSFILEFSTFSCNLRTWREKKSNILGKN